MVEKVTCIAQEQNTGCFPLCQRFRKFRSEFKWKGPFRFLPTGIFGITSRGGPHISVGIVRPKFAVPFLTNRFFALIREIGKGIKSSKSHSYWLARFNRKMSFHFRWVFPLISDRSVWHNGKHPPFPWPGIELGPLFGGPRFKSSSLSIDGFAFVVSNLAPHRLVNCQIISLQLVAIFTKFSDQFTIFASFIVS